MRIPINAHRAVRDNSTGVFANTNHGGFHVNMAVQKTRRDIRTCCIYNCCVLANTMSSVAHIGNTTLHNGNIHAVLDLSSTYIDQPRVPDDHIRWLTTLRYRSDGLRAFPERFFAKVI